MSSQSPLIPASSPAGCEYYSMETLEKFEEEAKSATFLQQKQGLKIIAQHLNGTGCVYGVMGGMNFFLRGSGRTTNDIDIAIAMERPSELNEVLDTFHDPTIIRPPPSRLLAASGVVRIFVRVGSGGQPVQIDLKAQTAEGHGMPLDLAAATEILNDPDAGPVRILAVGPLVRAKFQSYGRGLPGDYMDLLFVCTHEQYREEVRAVADLIGLSKREDFLEEVVRYDALHEETVRYALRLLEPGHEQDNTSTTL